MRSRLVGIGTLGLLGAACAYGTGQWASKTAPSASSAPRASVTAHPDRWSGASANAPLDLLQFEPLLAEAEFSQIRELQESGSHAEAARALAATAASAPGVGGLRRHFAAALLFEQAGSAPFAEAEYRAAAAAPWPLRSDAALRAAELAWAKGDGPGTQEMLTVASPLAQEPRFRILQARVKKGQGAVAEALELWAEVYQPGMERKLKLEVAAALRELPATLDGAGHIALRARLRRDLVSELAALEPESQEALALRTALDGLGVLPEPFEEKLAALRAAVAAQRYEAAVELGKSLVREPTAKLGSPARCEADALTSKALSLLRRWGEAFEWVRPSADACATVPTDHPALLFVAGKYAAADGRDAVAVRYYAELEKLYPKSSLADDARVRAARSFRDMGAASRSTELLMSLPEDYPDGDTTAEGVLDLALFRAERKDWGGAALVLERGAKAVAGRDHARGTEFSGTERYFLARAWAEQGDKARALDEYERIVRELPLSYYMLHAYSRLHHAAPERAKEALLAAERRASEVPFVLPDSARYHTPEFVRAMELFKVGDMEAGRQALTQAGLDENAEDALLWGIALLYDRAGDAHHGHRLVRGRLTDWLGHYPRGPWEMPWQLGFPRPYHDHVSAAAVAAGVPESLVYGVMREESTFDPSAESPAAAYGLMQLIVPTAKSVGTKAGLPWSREALLRPRINIQLGARLLADLSKRFSDNPWLAVPAYNAGPGRPARWLRERPDVDFDLWVELIPIRETRRYMKRVLASRAAYAFLYESGAKEEALLLPLRLSSGT